MNILDSRPHSKSAHVSVRAVPSAGFPGTDGLRYVVSTITNPVDLLPMGEQWQALAARAADPNPFYEPWFFLPAAQHLGPDQQWQILLVQRMDARKNGQLELCGFFPFVQSRGPAGISQWTLWKNPFCFLTSPLVDQTGSANVFRAVLNHCQFDRNRVMCLEMPMLAGEGPLHHGLTEVLREQLCTTYIPDQYLRATTTCQGDVDAYLKNALGGHHVREYRRKRRKLEALGQIEYRQIHEARSVPGWVEWFLDLESQGWKARAGTAIKLHPAETAFFREMIDAGYALGKVRLEGLFLNGEPIALKCLLFSSPAAFAFKIAFDETHHTCSPGVQLEFESLQRLADDPQVAWCDSCAVPGHQMIDRLWTERRLVRHLMISTGHCTSDVVIGSLPLFRSLNRVRKRWGEALSRKFKSRASTTHE